MGIGPYKKQKRPADWPDVLVELLARFELATSFPESLLSGNPSDLLLKLRFALGFGRQFSRHRIKKRPADWPDVLVELLARFELATSSLPRMRSTG